AGADEVDFEPAYAKKFPNIVQTERDLFEARKQAFAEQISGLQKQLRQKELKLDDLYTRINDLGEELDVIEEQLAIKQKLLNSGAISRSVYLETESRARNFETRINAAKKEVPITKSELQEVYSNIEEERQNNNAEIIEDLKDVRLDISTMTERIKALQDEVSRTAIRSPIKGIVNKLYINTIGGVISPGQTLADLVPLEETLVIEGRVATNDRGKIYPGLIVNAKIRAYDYTIYGGMTGELTQISADSFIEKDGSEYYRIRVTLTTSQLSADKPIYPGMTADLNILAGKTTVLSAILKPYKRIRDTAFTDI
ncbi:MAG: HlyD family type I secretion periplasmic adaptor subunit, partial [Alphaproteobacteria bacterium]|nr:HlyD family type I secretion periplasmic adaptor subunit [Alphaproteobacteria bacterium]